MAIHCKLENWNRTDNLDNLKSWCGCLPELVVRLFPFYDVLPIWADGAMNAVWSAGVRTMRATYCSAQRRFPFFFLRGTF